MFQSDSANYKIMIQNFSEELFAVLIVLQWQGLVIFLFDHEAVGRE